MVRPSMILVLGLVVLLGFVGPRRHSEVSAAEKLGSHGVSAITPLLAKRGQLIVDDDGGLPRGVDTKGVAGSQIRVRSTDEKWKWVTAAKVWRSQWKPGMGHTPVISYSQFKEKDLIVEVTFRFGLATESWHTQSFRVALDDRPLITGHVLSAWANPNNDFIQTGFLLQHIKKTPEKKVLKNLLLDQQSIQIVPGKWYTAIVEVVGDEALFRMGSHVAYAKSLEIAVPKNLMSLTVGTTWHEVKRVRIWKAVPNPEWSQRKAAVLESRQHAEDSSNNGDN